MRRRRIDRFVRMKMTLEPSCLEWARIRAGLTTSDLTEKLGVPEIQIAEWEQTGEITLARAEKLASVTRTPFGYLFLPSPPVEVLPIDDFRTIGSKSASISPNLIDAVNDAILRRDWYREYLIENGTEPLNFVGSLKVSTPILDAANQIRSVVAWDSAVRAKASSWDAALNRQIDAIEQIGVLVTRSGIVGNNTRRTLSVDEFRGFAIADSYAPLLFVNSRDARAAQMFTLAHELVHIWIGESGVSNLIQTRPFVNSIEQFCNAVAAELLVPVSDLRSQWDTANQYSDTVQRLSRYFKVSSLVILRRLLDVGYISEEEFGRRYNSELVEISRAKPSEGGGDFYKTLRVRLGKRFVSALVESTLEGGTLYRDAFKMLGVSKSDTLLQLAARIGANA